MFISLYTGITRLETASVQVTEQVLHEPIIYGSCSRNLVFCLFTSWKRLMHVPSKILISSQFGSSLIIVILVGHAGSYDQSYFGASPSAMALFQLSAANLFLTFFILVTAFNTDKIYETPLICMHGILFFLLLLSCGIVCIIESVKFESLQEKEIGVAGAVAILTSFTSVVGCCFSYNICENLKTL